VQKLVLSKQGESVDIKPGQHIVIIGMRNWQDIIEGHLRVAFGNSEPIIKCPALDGIISQLGQLEPSLLIISNFDLKCSLTLRQIIEKSTVPLKVIDSKFKLEKNLIPVVRELLP